jgi:hypothetical protein
MPFPFFVSQMLFNAWSSPARVRIPPKKIAANTRMAAIPDIPVERAKGTIAT